MNSSTHVDQQHHQKIKREAADWYAKMKPPQRCRETEAEFKQWLAQNPQHELAYAQCQVLWEMTDSLQRDADIQREIQAAVSHTSTKRIVPYLPAAAALLVVAVAGLLFTFNQPSNLYSTSIGEHRLVRLADGSTVMLNTDTVITVNYSNNRRQIELRKGEAYFDVEKDRQRSFDVQASGSIVKAVGTEFNVRMRKRAISIAVVEGIVEVKPEKNSTAQFIAQVGQGEAITYHNDHSIPAIETANLERIAAWKNRKIYFKSDRLVDAVAEYNRYTNKQIYILDKELENQLISGIFNVGDLRSFTFSLEQLLGVHIVSQEDGIYVMK